MNEQLVGEVLVALIKACNGEITLSAEDLVKQPSQVAVIYKNDDGSVTLKVKDISILDH